MQNPTLSTADEEENVELEAESEEKVLEILSQKFDCVEEINHAELDIRVNNILNKRFDEEEFEEEFDEEEEELN